MMMLPRARALFSCFLFLLMVDKHNFALGEQSNAFDALFLEHSFLLAKAKSTPSASTNFTIQRRSSRSHRRPHRRWALIWMPHLIILAKCPHGSWTRAELQLGSIFSFNKFNPITDLSVSSAKLASFRDNPGTPCGWDFPPSSRK